LLWVTNQWEEVLEKLPFCYGMYF